MNTVQIVLAIAVPLLMMLVKAWIDIKIKFAKDASQAIRDAKSDIAKVAVFLFKIIQPVAYLYIAWAMVRLFVTDPWPLSRSSFAAIILDCFFIFNGIMMFWVNRLNRVDSKIVDVTEALIRGQEARS